MWITVVVTGHRDIMEVYEKWWAEIRGEIPSRHQTVDDCAASFGEQFACSLGRWKDAPYGMKYTPSRWITLTPEDVDFLGIAHWTGVDWGSLNPDMRRRPDLLARLKVGGQGGVLIRKGKPCDRLSKKDLKYRCENQCTSGKCPKSRFFGKRKLVKRKPRKVPLGWIGQGKPPGTRPLVGGRAWA